MSGSDGLGPELAERSLFGFPLSSWRRITGEGAWALAGQVAVAAAGLVAIRLLTELAPKEVFGEASLVLGAMMLGRRVFFIPVWSAQLRFHPEYRQKGQARWFTREVARLSWMSAGVFAAVGTCAYLLWRVLSGGGWRPLLALALAGILVTDVTKALKLNRLNAERRQGRYALWTGVQAWLWPALAALFLVLWTSTESYLWGQVAGSAAALVVFGVIAYPRIQPDASDSAPKPRGVFLKKMLAYGLPLVPVTLLGWATAFGDRYILAGFMGKADVGLYVAAYAVASRPFLVANGVLMIVARPVLYEAENGNRVGKAKKVFVLYLLAAAAVGLIGVLGFWLLGEWVAWMLLAEEYRAGATRVFLWIALGYAIHGLQGVIGRRILSLRKTGTLLLPAGFGAGANILLAFLLVPSMGALGAAQAKAAGFAVRSLAVTLALVGAREPRTTTDERADRR